MNPYEILGVSRTASQEEIKKAYREATLKWHPDKNPNDPSAEEHYKMINNAYGIIGDPQQREIHDLQIELPDGQVIDAGEAARLFSAFFGSFIDESMPKVKRYAEIYQKMQEEKHKKKEKKYKKRDKNTITIKQGSLKLKITRIKNKHDKIVGRNI